MFSEQSIVLAKYLPLHVTQLDKESFVLTNKTPSGQYHGGGPLLVPCRRYAEKLFSSISPMTSSFTVCAPGDVACHLTDTDTTL
jgi:hypothetical protein